MYSKSFDVMLIFKPILERFHFREKTKKRMLHFFDITCIILASAKC